MGQCSQAECAAAATCLPAFVIPFRNGREPRRIVVPIEVCVAHGERIGVELASPARRAALARECGAASSSIDWSRCRFELVPASRPACRVEPVPFV